MRVGSREVGALYHPAQPTQFQQKDKQLFKDQEWALGIWGQLRLEILRLVYFNKRCYKIGQSNIRKAMLILK